METTNIMWAAGGWAVGLLMGLGAGWAIFRSRGATAAAPKAKPAPAAKKASGKKGVLPPPPKKKVDAYEVADIHVARVDIERGSYVSVEWHLKDIMREIRDNGDLRDIMRFVILGFKTEGDQLYQEPLLLQYFAELQRRIPHIVLFLERQSLDLFIRMMRAGRMAGGSIDPSESSDQTIENLEQELLGQASASFTSALSDSEKNPQAVLEKLLDRAAEVFDDLEEKEAAVALAAAEAAETIGATATAAHR